jgi:DNA anti-recombination protein RmuC
MSQDISEMLSRFHNELREELASRVEKVCTHYEAQLKEKDREIDALRGALLQSAKDFKALQEKNNERGRIPEGS